MIAREALYSPYNGDFVETGVYTGGTSAIMMRILMDFDACSRKFYAFDSFAGLPGSQPEDRAGSGMKGDKVVTTNDILNHFQKKKIQRMIIFEFYDGNRGSLW